MNKYMEVVAVSKSVKISPRKVRLVADSIRNLSIGQALNTLILLEKKSALAIGKTLKSALANAKNNAKLAEENLYIKRIEIGEGVVLKRFKPSTRGRTHPLKKRSSHIRIVLTDDKSQISNVKSQIK